MRRILSCTICSIIFLLLSTFVLFFFTSCDMGPKMATIPMALSKSKNIVPVFYGTDRTGEGPFNNRSYTGFRNNGDFEYGLTYVSIPEKHDPGEIERPFRFLFIEFQEDIEKHFVIIEPPHKLSKDTFFYYLQKQVRLNSEDGVFVFIHGYKVSFEEAIFRTGQLSYDLGFKGPAVAYSWPSKDKLKDYLTDGDEVKITRPYLKRFLTDIREQSGAKNVFVLAHSMGSRAFTEVLVDMARENEGNNDVLFNQILLAAPDINAQYFKDTIAPAIKGTAKGITLYASSNDNVLEFSSKLRDKEPRAGQSGDNIVIVNGIDTIDASSTNEGFFKKIKLGHSYYGKDLLVDMHYTIKEMLPKDRMLTKKEVQSGIYWIWKRY